MVHPPLHRVALYVSHSQDLINSETAITNLVKILESLRPSNHCVVMVLYNELSSLIWSLRFRAIYRWITYKDLNKLQLSEAVQDSPMGLLRGIKYGTETYHTLFKRLCRYVQCSVPSVLCTFNALDIQCSVKGLPGGWYTPCTSIM